MNMIERVARVIAPEAWSIVCSTPNCYLCEQNKELAYETAKAAIAAMREFTDEMSDASDSRLVRAELEQNWQNVIDAALKEKS